jgi:hypothetical protein
LVDRVKASIANLAA